MLKSDMNINLKSLPKPLDDKAVCEAVNKYLSKTNFDNQRILLIVPDNTRSGPIGKIFKYIFAQIGNKVKNLDILIALGTHQPLSEEQICKRLEITVEQRHKEYKKVGFFNHEWENPSAFTNVGTISSEKISELTNRLFAEKVNVALNKLIFDYDRFFILGPVFPHEVVGFSGGHKYLFPGIAGAEIIDFFHWLGAIITNPAINGTKWTPTRQVVEQAASFIKVPHHLFAIVAKHNQIYGLFVGDTVTSWEQAADLSSQLHIHYTGRKYHTVFGIAPEMYDDLWTAGKVMYKLEPIVSDGGTLIIYAPHITEVSYTHGKILDRIGYHTRDYFLKQKELFTDIPGGVKAHSTHVKGIGSFENGIEKPRIKVVLASGISEERCRKINLDYMNPASVKISDYENKECQGVLLVRHAGEILYRLKE
jgi:nickel-dependent lactate racemase